MTTVDIYSVDFNNAFKAAPKATKFLAQINLMNTEDLKNPETGEWLTRDGKSLEGQTGVVIYNHTDKCWQGVIDGEWIIFNNPAPEEAETLYRIIFNGPVSGSWFVEDLKKTLSILTEMGFKDYYPTNSLYLQKVVPISAKYTAGMREGFGGYVQKKTDILVLATFVPGDIVITGGPADQPYSDGAYVVEEGDKRVAVRPDKFEQTYVRLP